MTTVVKELRQYAALIAAQEAGHHTLPAELLTAWQAAHSAPALPPPPDKRETVLFDVAAALRQTMTRQSAPPTVADVSARLAAVEAETAAYDLITRARDLAVEELGQDAAATFGEPGRQLEVLDCLRLAMVEAVTVARDAVAVLGPVLPAADDLLAGDDHAQREAFLTLRQAARRYTAVRQSRRALKLRAEFDEQQVFAEDRGGFEKLWDGWWYRPASAAAHDITSPLPAEPTGRLHALIVAEVDLWLPTPAEQDTAYLDRVLAGPLGGHHLNAAARHRFELALSELRPQQPSPAPAPTRRRAPAAA